MANKYIIGGPASQQLAEEVAKLMDLPLIKTEFKKFPDGENYVRLEIEQESFLKDAELIVIQTTDNPQNDHLWELLYIISIARRIGAAKIHAVVPYLAYSRQDKAFRPGEAVSARLILRLIENAGATAFYTVDLHSEDILDEFTIPAYNLDAMPYLAEYLKSQDLKNPVVISPDKGSRERSGQFAKLIGAELVMFDKSRDRITGEISMTGDVKLEDRDVAIADDIIASGGTMAAAMKIAKDGGARKLYALCSHALLIKNAEQRLKDAGVEAIIGTNAVNSPVSVVSVARLISESLKDK
ncbi:MAG: ribose-phosphate diphosphokinase [Candidatus Hodarchaeota archaeon]